MSRFLSVKGCVDYSQYRRTTIDALFSHSVSTRSAVDFGGWRRWEKERVSGASTERRCFAVFRSSLYWTHSISSLICSRYSLGWNTEKSDWKADSLPHIIRRIILCFAWTKSIIQQWKERNGICLSWRIFYVDVQKESCSDSSVVEP